LPTRLEKAASIDQLRSSGFTQVVLLFGEVSKDNLGTEVTWGIVGPTPAFTTETKITYKFRITAWVYDLVAGDVVTEASAVNFASGSHGVMVGFPTTLLQTNSSTSTQWEER
jgi:O-succinylbenzoate synthase